MKDAITNLLKKSNALPTLFIGSGLTRRYLDLPNWEGLLKQVCRYLPKEYGFYFTNAKSDCLDHPDMILPTVATYIQRDFSEIWYTDSTFKDQRETYKSEIEHGVSPLKIYISDFFKNQSNNTSSQYATEIEKLKAIGNKHISSIITTNYDLFFENCFGYDNFRTFIGQNELLFSPLLELAEIYKIHGCCSKPESIIIDAHDYQQFMDKSNYLSAKLLTIFLENPIIFIGYSLSDPNIKCILSSICNCLENSQLETLKDRLIFVEWNTSGEQDAISEKTFTFENGKSISMKSISLTDYGILYDAIAANNVKYEVKALRRIKEQLYTLVKTNQPTEKLYIATSLDSKTTDDDIDFVVGVGVYSKFGQVGYQGLSLNHLYRYVLGCSDLEYDDNMILDKTIPELYNGKSNLPVCKLVSNCTNCNAINMRVKDSFKSNFDDFLTQFQKNAVKKCYYDMKCSIATYYSINKLNKTLSKIPLLDPDQIDIDDLYNFLTTALNDDPSLLSLQRGVQNQSNSNFRKCISIWDWLKYHSSAEKQMNTLLNI